MRKERLYNLQKVLEYIEIDLAKRIYTVFSDKSKSNYLKACTIFWNCHTLIEIDRCYLQINVNHFHTKNQIVKQEGN